MCGVMICGLGDRRNWRVWRMCLIWRIGGGGVFLLGCCKRSCGLGKCLSACVWIAGRDRGLRRIFFCES